MPSQSAYLEAFGLFLAGQKDDVLAGQFLQAAIERDRANPRRYEHFVSWLLDKGRDSEARQVLQTLFGLRSLDAAREVKRLLAAGVPAELLYGVLPMRVQPRIAFARQMQKQGNLDLAGRAYGDALALLEKGAEGKPWYFGALFQFFMQQKQYGRAVQVMEEGIEHYPGRVDLYLHLGAALAQQGEVSRAARWYRLGLEHARTVQKPQPWYFTAPYWFYMKQKEYDRAGEVLQQGIKRLPRDAGLHRLLGDYYRSRKMMVSARLEYEQAHALKPNDPQIKQRLDALKTAEEKIEEQVDSLLGIPGG